MSSSGSTSDADRAPLPSPGWSRNRRLLALGSLLAVVGAFWVSNLRQGLPYLHHPDEPTNLRVVNQMVIKRDTNPHFFNYPSLFLYVQTAVHPEGPLLAWLGEAEAPPQVQVMGSARSDYVGSVVLHRLVTVAFGLLAVVAAYAATRVLTDDTVGSLGAAALVATSLTLTASARAVTPDVMATALVTCTLWASAHVLRRGGWRPLALSGLLVGLSASTKYNALAVLAVPGMALLVGAPRRLRLGRRVGHGLLLATTTVAGFLLTTPYSVLAWKEFRSDVRFEMRHYATGHEGMEGNAARWYLSHLLTREAVVSALAAAGLAILLRHRRYGVAAVVMAFPVVYGTAIAMQPVRNARTILLLIPFLAVLGGVATGHVVRLLTTVTGRGRTWATTAIVLSAVGLVALQGLGVVSVARAQSYAHTTVPPLGRLQPSPTTWDQARAWIDANVPPGSVVHVEAYSPWVDPERFDVRPVMSLADLTSDELASPGWFVASGSMYARFMDDPGTHRREATAYQRIFDQATIEATFRGSGPDIAVLHLAG